jgi:hypothetical protein
MVRRKYLEGGSVDVIEGNIVVYASLNIHLGLKVVKVKLSLRLTKYHAMKTFRGVEVQLHAVFTLALDKGEWSASGPGHFTPKESP